MAIENDPSARIQLRSRGELQLPGSCYVCGNGTDERGFLDFGTFVDYHGNFYLCSLCAGQAAEVLGYHPPEVMDLQRQGMEAKLVELAETKAELADAREHIASLNTLLGSRFTPNSSGPLDVTSIKIESNDNNGSPSPFKKGNDGESEVEELDLSGQRSDTNGAKPRNSAGKRSFK